MNTQATATVTTRTLPLAPVAQTPRRMTWMERIQAPFRGLPSNVYRLGWVSFFADISSEMLYPLLPIFLTATIGAPVYALGLIEGVGDAIAALLQTSFGRASDRSGTRRPYVITGYLTSAAARPFLALASGWTSVLFARSVDRFGKAVRIGARDAMLADSVEPALRGRAFGMHRGLDTLGAVIGPIFALSLVDLGADRMRWVFLLSVIPATLAGLLMYAVREPRRASVVPLPAATTHAPRAPMVLSPEFKRLLLGWGAFSLVNSSDMFLVLRAKQLGLSTTTVVLAYVFYNFIYAIGSFWLGHLSDRIGRKSILVGGLVTFAAVYAGMAFATSTPQVFALFGIYGLYIAATDGVGKAFVVDLVPASSRATAVGIFGTITGVSSLASNAVAGALWSILGSTWAFSYGALGALVAAGVIHGIGARSQEVSHATAQNQ